MQTDFNNIVSGIKKLYTLEVDTLKLTLTEKLSLILGAAALYLVAIIIVMILLVGIYVGLCFWLIKIMPLHWALIILSAGYLVILGLVFAFKKQLFFNPIARFLSKLIIEHPTEKDQQ
jgi:hypothetical protein